MRKKLSKHYPKFEACSFRLGRNSETHWCDTETLPTVPQRFGKIYHSKEVSSEEENFIAFASHVIFDNDTRHTTQDGYFMYNSQVVLNTPYQLRGDLPNGDVDFFVGEPFVLENGGVLNEPGTRRSIRYPYRVATYFPIRNVLIIKDLVFDSRTPSLFNLLSWIFEKVDSVGYKYNKHGTLLIGCDPEFNIIDLMDERVSADKLFPDPNRNSPIGTDGSASTGELRPSPADCPVKLTGNIKELMKEMAKKIGNDKKVLTGGGRGIAPTGHHIHFNKMISSEETELLDAFVGIPALQIDGAKRPNTEYEVTGKRAVRSQPHGCEYRTPASSLIPELACALHVTAYCCIMKWETLAEGETFEFSINDVTNIPTIEAYRALDITEDKRYTPHLEEFWNWVNKKDGRKIDPKRDCLHFWIENRKEVKPVPGLKINWASNIFPRSNKDTFVELASFDKISDISVYIIQPVENEEDIIAHICCPSEIGRSLNKSRLEKLKIKYGMSGISGFNNTTVKLGVSQALINKARTAKALQKMVIAFAEELYR